MEPDANDDRNRGRNDGARDGTQDGHEDEDRRVREGGENVEPSDSPWTQQQGLYGSTEYGGWLGGQSNQGGVAGEDAQGSKSRVQGHAGKGPKEMQRSDERVREDVGEALARHPDIDASGIEVQVASGEVTLKGGLDEPTTKRLAENVVESVRGVQEARKQPRKTRDGGRDGS
ncbi:MAG: BON domain-containing protein [Cytophagaceae bacterium]|nr:BON domain-containing protein [Gemmatimonadaceae bacterium]